MAATVYILDDEPNILTTLEGCLRDEGFEVVTQSNPLAIEEDLERVRPDVVLLDIWMPERDGIEALSIIKAFDPSIEVIVITGHGNIRTAVEVTRLGAYDFVEKPIDLDTLLRALNGALAHRGAERPAAPPAAGGIAATPGRASRHQRTLRRSVVVGGMGLHSGEKTGLILSPLPPGSGILFTDINRGDTVPALVDYVDTTGFATTLRHGTTVVHTTEHFLAALSMYGITNLMVKVHEELPIMDGSATEFCRVIEEAGIEEQAAEISPLIVEETHVVGDEAKGVYLKVEPSEELIVSYTIDYPAPIGQDTYTFHATGPEAFREEIAPARTFGFLKDIAKLEQMGLGGGGRMDNFILVDDEAGRVMNTELRFPNEFTRHKILDILGDFALLGRPIV
ncbi:MAG: UDP-3-O-[3-hydroxymyristoyl] N-acetylglucosamine deacetylase, partial [Nitrospirae bacterium]